jgi:hypothetical protein
VVISFYEKDGGSKHADIVKYCKQQLTQFNLPYSKAVFVVTDTEATIAGCLFVSNSVAHCGKMGCIDHLVQLFTKIAFKGIVFCSFTAVRRNHEDIP